MPGIITWAAEPLSSVPAIKLSGALLVLYVVGSSIRSWYRLRHIKGPWLASFSYLWLLRSTSTGKQGQGFRDVSDKYGPLVRIGPNDLLTSDPEVIRRMGRTSSKPAYGRSTWYSALRVDPYHTSLFSTRDTQAHDKLKAKLSFGYGGRENPTLEASVDDQLAAFVGLIRQRYVSVGADLKAIDMATAVQYFTLDALSKVAFGNALGYLATDSDVFDFIKETEKFVPGLVMASEVPWLGTILLSPTFLKFFGPKPTDKKGFGKMLKLALELTEARHAPDAKDERDMLGAFIRHGVGKRDCQAEIPFQVIAGSDTTATAIRGTLLNLMTAPHAYQKLLSEIDEAVANGAVSSPVKVDEARKLPYLQAVLYEGLRLNIPFTGLASKEVPPEGDTIHGQYVPGGTRIGQSGMAMQRSKAVFGNSADLFRPERWIEVDEAEKMRWRQHVELVFGSGRWGCSGKSVAFMELNKVYVELFRRFDMQLVYPGSPIETLNMNNVFQKNMWVRVTERFPESPAQV